MKSKEDIFKQFESHRSISRSGLSSQYAHIDEGRAFYSGDYMNYRDELMYGLGGSRRVQEVQFNRVKPYVNSIVGFMAQNRRKPDYQARLPDMRDQQMYSEYLNGFSDYIRENANADQIETRQDLDMVIGGVGVTDTAVTIKSGTPTRDPKGEVALERVDALEVGWDPSCTSTNLLGSRWVFRAKEYDVEEAEDLFDADSDDFGFVDIGDEINNYQFNPFGGIQDKVGYEYADPQRQMVRVYFYQWFEIEPFYRIENPIMRANDSQAQQTIYNALSLVDSYDDDELFRFNIEDEMLCITKANYSQVKSIFKAFDLPFSPIKEKRMVYYTAVISGAKVFTAYKSVSQQGFSLKFKTGDRDERNNIWVGIVASLRDPQRYYNKSLTELMLIIASNSRGGVMYERSAIENVQEFESRYALTNAAVMVEDGAISGNKIIPKATPKQPNGYEEILQISDAAMEQVTGISEAMFGVTGGGNETAMLQRQRIKQATVVLASYFDAAALYAKEQARMLLSFMRLLADTNNGALFRMSDGQGNYILEQLSPDFFADEYDIVISEAPETPVQKEFYAQTLISMAQSMQAIGDPMYKQIYAEAIKHLPISDKDKASITRLLTDNKTVDVAVVEQLQQQIQQLQSQGAQIAMAKEMAEIQRTQADAQSKIASISKTNAETRETIESADQKAIESDIMAMTAPNKINVTI